MNDLSKTHCICSNSTDAGDAVFAWPKRLNLADAEFLISMLPLITRMIRRTGESNDMRFTGFDNVPDFGRKSA